MQIASGSEQMMRVRESQQTDQLARMREIRNQPMDDKRIKEVSQEFESLFVNELLKSMRKTVPENEWLNGGMQQEVFEDMLYNEYARSISKSGGIGLGDMVYKSLKATAASVEPN